MKEKALAVVVHYVNVGGQENHFIPEMVRFWLYESKYADKDFPHTLSAVVETGPDDAIAKAIEACLDPKVYKVHKPHGNFKFNDSIVHVVPVVCYDKDPDFNKDVVEGVDSINDEDYVTAVAGNPEAQNALKPKLQGLIAELWEKPEYWMDLENMQKESKELTRGEGLL